MSETSKKSFIWGSDTTQANNSNSDNDVIEYTNNHIYFYAKINKENICKLNKLIYLVSEELKKINNTYDTQVVIYLHINTTGGLFLPAILVWIKLQHQKYPYTIIEGCYFSAGTLISMLKDSLHHSYMLIHQLVVLWGKFIELEDEFENLQI